jgi:KDO2-lipid IV(A) lauroyltransferase
MGISLNKIINSRLGIGLASGLAFLIPFPVGHRLTDFVGRRIAAHSQSDLVRAVRLNQWVARGRDPDPAALDRAVIETLQNSARTIFDLYHYLHNNPAAEKVIVLDGSVRPLLERPEFAARGVMVVGVHISNFDLVMRALTRKGLRPFILTIPDPQGGRKIEFELRRKAGMNLHTPSLASLRAAIKHLQEGGAVMTGMDRPVPDPDVRPVFFGHPASLPTHHITLALKTGVPVVILVTIRREDGKSVIFASDPIEMDRFPDRKEELQRNAEKVIRVAEEFIRRSPGQWSMPIPVWPDLMDQVP